jgi:hypothetical protein
MHACEVVGAYNQKFKQIYTQFAKSVGLALKIEM